MVVLLLLRLRGIALCVVSGISGTVVFGMLCADCLGLRVWHFDLGAQELLH